VGAVGRADLLEDGTALGHNVRDPERAPDFDQVPARDDHAAAPGEGFQADEHRPGVVVDHHGILGAGDLAQEVPHGRVARAAPAGREVVLEVGVAPGHGQHALHRLLGQQGAAEVGVDDDARGVHHPPQIGRHRLPDGLLDLREGARVGMLRRTPAVVGVLEDAAALGLDHSTDRPDQDRWGDQLEGRVGLGELDDTIDGRKFAQELLLVLAEGGRSRFHAWIALSGAVSNTCIGIMSTTCSS
jgi:hypothetical protein